MRPNGKEVEGAREGRRGEGWGEGGEERGGAREERRGAKSCEIFLQKIFGSKGSKKSSFKNFIGFQVFGIDLKCGFSAKNVF